MSDTEQIRVEVRTAIERGDYRTAMIGVKYHLKRDLTSDEANDLTRNCLRWSGRALMAAKQGASESVVEGLIKDFIGDGVSAAEAAKINRRNLSEDEVDVAIHVAMGKRYAFHKILKIAYLGISQEYLGKLLVAYKILQEDEKYSVLSKLQSK